MFWSLGSNVICEIYNAFVSSFAESTRCNGSGTLSAVVPVLFLDKYVLRVARGKSGGGSALPNRLSKWQVKTRNSA